jgi:hypothetical protein
MKCCISCLVKCLGDHTEPEQTSQPPASPTITSSHPEEGERKEGQSLEKRVSDGAKQGLNQSVDHAKYFLCSTVKYYCSTQFAELCNVIFHPYDMSQCKWTQLEDERHYNMDFPKRGVTVHFPKILLYIIFEKSMKIHFQEDGSVGLVGVRVSLLQLTNIGKLQASEITNVTLSDDGNTVYFVTNKKQIPIPMRLIPIFKALKMRWGESELDEAGNIVPRFKNVGKQNPDMQPISPREHKEEVPKEESSSPPLPIPLEEKKEDGIKEDSP